MHLFQGDAQGIFPCPGSLPSSYARMLWNTPRQSLAFQTQQFTIEDKEDKLNSHLSSQPGCLDVCSRM